MKNCLTISMLHAVFQSALVKKKEITITKRYTSSFQCFPPLAKRKKFNIFNHP